jgi:hypothetical protein
LRGADDSTAGISCNAHDAAAAILTMLDRLDNAAAPIAHGFAGGLGGNNSKETKTNQPMKTAIYHARYNAR